MNNRMELRKEREGRMGEDLHTIWIVFVDGVEVGHSRRKWFAQALGDAVVAGHVPAGGNTAWALSQWAKAHAPDLYARIVLTGEDGMQ